MTIPIAIICASVLVLAAMVLRHLDKRLVTSGLATQVATDRAAMAKHVEELHASRDGVLVALDAVKREQAEQAHKIVGLQSRLR